MWYMWYVFLLNVLGRSAMFSTGKFWHRHRRPRPVKYNRNPEFHTSIKHETELAKTIAKKKGGAAALRGQSTTLPATPADGTSEPPTPTRSKGDVEAASRNSQPPTVPPSEDERAVSPVSTASSASEPPLAQRVLKLNGTNHAPSAPPAPRSTGRGSTQPDVPPTSNSAPQHADAVPFSPPKAWVRLLGIPLRNGSWLTISYSHHLGSQARCRPCLQNIPTTSSR